MAFLELKNIDKIYPNGVQAVFDFNIEVEQGDFIVLVGPSGCGKSTTLRMIAGLEEITAGEMILDGNLINDKAPVDRDIAMVFQNYALYNHMTSYENVGIGLRVRHETTSDIHHKVMNASDILGLDEYLNRTPKKLSGGQRQRVALGRTIVREPKVFLMDEPLSNLDAKLRGKTRKELVKLHKRLDATIIYVTHDQIEAMTMATRMVVMKDGYVQQIGTPFEVYTNPVNLFVGSFIGVPPMNFIKGQIRKGFFYFDDQRVYVPEDRRDHLEAYEGKEIILGVRPEQINDLGSLTSYKDEEVVHLKVVHKELLGSHYNVMFEVNKDQKMIAIIDANSTCVQDKVIDVVFNMEKAHFFDVETELNIRKVE